MWTLLAALIVAVVGLGFWYFEVLDDAGRASFRGMAAHRWRRMVKAVTDVLYGGGK